MFGQARSGGVYQPRLGAYALIRSPDGRLAIVLGQQGRMFLPGGGHDQSETPEAALRREAVEECGWRIEVGPLLAEAIQYVRAGEEGDFRLHAQYFPAELLEDGIGNAEHPVTWLAPAEAALRLHRAADRWVVGGLAKAAGQ